MTEITELARKVEQVGSGKKQVLNDLFLAWSKKVKLDWWVRRKTLQVHDAEDLKQEILINIFERFQEYDSTRASFETWAFNRARQVTRSFIRTKIKSQTPVQATRKGKETLRVKLVSIPDEGIEDTEFSIDGELYYEELLENLKMAIDTIHMAGTNREHTKNTLDLLAEGKGRQEMSKILRVTPAKIDGDIKRIRKAAEILSESMMIF